MQEWRPWLTMATMERHPIDSPRNPAPCRAIPVYPGICNTRRPPSANLIRSKIERAGYTDISVLERDNWGVWRGRAKKGDSLVTVVVDKGGRIKSEPAR